MAITGGAVTQVGDWTYVAFTSSGTAVVSEDTVVEYLVVGGGGGGGGNGYNNPASGGGGGGEVVVGTATISAGNVVITVGAGGAGGAVYGASNEPGAYAGGTGSASIIAAYATAIGGGGGAGDNEGAIPDTQGPTAGAGGGGGSSGSTATGATGSVSSGGDAVGDAAGGGGGAGGDGEDGNAGTGSDGGPGVYVDDFAQFGDSGYFGGGGGGGRTGQGVGAGDGGIGGGGGGLTQTAGDANTGGGGSGRRDVSFHNAQPGAAGGSGIVVLRYAPQTARAADPDGGWWIEVWDLDNTQRLMDDDPPAMQAQFEKLLNDIGAGRVTLPASWSRLSEVCDPPNDVSTLIKVYVQGSFRYAFRSDQIEYEYAEDGASTVTVSGAGYEVIVDDGDVPAFDYPTNPSLSGDWVYGEQTVYDYGFDNATYIAISTATAGAGTATWQQYSLTFTGTSDTTRLAVIGTTESETWYIANATVTDDTGGFTIYTADWDAGNEDGWDFGEATGTAGGTAGGGGPAGYGTAWLEIQSNATDAGHNARVDDIQTSPDRRYTFTVQIAGGGDYYLLAKDMESLDGWFVGEASAKVVNGPVGGDEALKVTTNANDTDEVFHQVRKTFSTQPGSNYTFTALVAGTASYWLVARDMTAEGADFLSSESFIGGGGTVSPGGTSAYATATWEFTAPGNATRFAIQTAQDNDVFYIGQVTINQGRDAESFGAIVNDVFTAVQAQANATALTWTFDDSLDSAGSAWSPATVSITIPDGPPAGTMLDRGVGLGHEWRVVPASGDEGYKLEVFNNGNLGTDYTTDPAAPVIRQGGIIYGGRSRQQAAKNVVRVTTAGGYWAEATDASSTAAIGRRVEAIQNSQSSGTAIAQEIADARLAAHQAQINSVWLEMGEQSTDAVPFVDYDVGDVIGVQLLDVIGVDGWLRVHSIRADLLGEGNDVRYSVELR